MLALSLLFLATSFIPTARADWMNLTGAETAPNIAEITVLDDRVRIALEVYIGDLATFEALLPDEWLKTDVAARSSLAERLKRFSAETLQVVTGDGTRLQADLKLAEARLRKDRASPFAGMINPMTRRRVPGAPEDKRVLYAELEYPFSGRPGSLTIVPPRNADGEAAVTIGFIAYHKSVPIIDFRYLSGPARVALDWGDPWYTKFDNPNLKRHHKSALMAFLYVEPREVRHEVLIRVRDLQDWTDLGLNGDAVIEYADRARIKERAQAFFATRNPLEVDGVPAMPAATRAEFLNVTLTGLRVIEDDNPLDLSTAILGIILSYPAKHLPQHVSVEWDLFSERVQRIPTTAIDPAGPFLGSVEAADPTFEWRNFLLKYQEPVVSPVVLDDGRAIGVPALSVLLVIFALGRHCAGGPSRLAITAHVAGGLRRERVGRGAAGPRRRRRRPEPVCRAAGRRDFRADPVRRPCQREPRLPREGPGRIASGAGCRRHGRRSRGHRGGAWARPCDQGRRRRHRTRRHHRGHDSRGHNDA
jgi:hypothetical protein